MEKKEQMPKTEKDDPKIKILGLISEIDKICRSIRKHINTTRYQNKLIKNLDNWNQICCSIDVIEDTACAIAAYIESNYPKEVGLRYIFTYGILQALFMQQDSFKHISEAFNIPYKISKELKDIREIRNAAIGHPTKQDRTPEKKTYYNYISRMTLSKKGFTLSRSYDQGENEFRDIQLFSMIEDQLSEIKSSYEVIDDELKKADKMHKEKFKDNLLSDIFPNTMGYFFQKISEGTYSDRPGKLPIIFGAFQQIQDAYLTFENSLQRRGDVNDDIQSELDEYKHALSVMRKYLTGEKINGMNSKDARIYCYYLESKHEYFLEIAQEVDDNYNT